ncbi:MAG: D-alanyl-D-alanine carboxypeptidase [Ruminococcaceae bacterium]|nr:D-alanyl-D-alanine carboxypeptidase [Oscillospiraceae bacterium]
MKLFSKRKACQTILPKNFSISFICIFLIFCMSSISYAKTPDIYPVDIPTESFWFDEAIPSVNFNPEYDTRAFILMEASTGKILCSSNENIHLPIASVTKIMSTLLIVEAIDSGKIALSDIVCVSEYASSMGGSQVFLEPGEKMSVDDLLKSLIVVSANDAAVALAEHIYGSASVFVQTMNEKAKELGMVNTNFINTTGLDEENHYSSALDVAIMTRELLKHELIFKYTCIWMDTIRNGAFGLSNTNRLVRFYDGANGMKTGFTDKAKYCLSGTAKRNDMQLIAVVLGAETSNERFAVTKSLLDYGFANYNVFTPQKLNIENLNVDGGEKTSVSVDYNPKSLLLKKGEMEKIEQKAVLESNLVAPVKKGQVIGKIIYSMNGAEIGETAVTASENIKKVSSFIIFTKIWSGILQGIF